MVFQRSFLSVFINKEELVIACSITNQFYLDKILVVKKNIRL